MKLSRRRVLHLAAAAVAFPEISARAATQAYPARPLRVIVGIPPGGSTDLLASGVRPD
jgi:tripartite-type tricarboxylate transporter receptor subunit TctC